jgi:hypothetical protein
VYCRIKGNQFGELYNTTAASVLTSYIVLYLTKIWPRLKLTDIVIHSNILKMYGAAYIQELNIDPHVFLNEKQTSKQL